MGRIKKGILGGFNGKVGTVVGAKWKGVAYMRSLPQNVKNPKTLPQLKQRAKLALVVKHLKPLAPMLRVGWKDYAKKQSAFNAATAYMLANGIVGNYPDYRIISTRLIFSRGPLTPPQNVNLDISGNILSLTWDDNSEVGNAKPTDKILIVFYNEVKNEAVMVIGGATRASRRHENVMDRRSWSGDLVSRYVAFISEDGKEVSNSVYAWTHRL